MHGYLRQPDEFVNQIEISLTVANAALTYLKLLWTRSREGFCTANHALLVSFRRNIFTKIAVLNYTHGVLNYTPVRITNVKVYSFWGQGNYKPKRCVIFANYTP